MEKYDEKQHAGSQYNVMFLLRYFPVEGSVLSGLEEEICRYLHPARVSHEVFTSETAFAGRARAVFSTFFAYLIENLKEKTLNPFQITRFCLLDVKDLITPALKDDPDIILSSLARFNDVASQALETPDNFDELSLSVINEVFDLFNDPNLPKPVLDVLQPAFDLKKKKEG